MLALLGGPARYLHKNTVVQPHRAVLSADVILQRSPSVHRGQRADQWSCFQWRACEVYHPPPNVLTDASSPPDRTAALTHRSNHSFPNGDIILKWICEELCSWCWAPGEYLIGKHTGGFSGDKMPQRAQRRPSVYFFPFHIAAHSSRPPSISKTFIAVIERGEELKEDEWENHFFRPQKLL